VGVGSRSENAILRALELGRSDHLHRFRDLLGFLDGIDLPSDGLETRHVVLSDMNAARYHLL
jgi:hypothetical protein